VKPADARREAHRILRDSARSMARSVHEAERLLRLAAGADETETIELRRSVEHERLINPEFFATGCA
jgi:hypothetical protein